MPQFYYFKMLLTGVPATEETVKKLFESGCGRVQFTLHPAVSMLTAEFSREAPSFADAVASATADIRRANVGLDVAWVHPEWSAAGGGKDD